MTTRTWAGRSWRIEARRGSVDVDDRGALLTFGPTEVGALSLERRAFRWHLSVNGRRLVKLPGLRRADARDLHAELRALRFFDEIERAAAWVATLNDTVDAAVNAGRWITTEQVDELDISRPSNDLRARVARAACEHLLEDNQRVAIAYLDADLRARVAAVNERILASELRERRSFFDTIEKSPLTEEQAAAVVCFDNRVQVLAAAGSGKTSVMVARAAYAVARGFTDPERILLLAFNKAAASELDDRIRERFAAAGLNAEGIRASTFHAFGLDVIRQATGTKPRVASWLADGNGAGKLLEIVAELSERSERFRLSWDLYRTLFAKAPLDLTEHEPDGYDAGSKETGYRTYGGDVVRSHGERLIADFLYLNHVDYEYEKDYFAHIGVKSARSYHPDFYYPAVDVWHEHWALGADGEPPAAFAGYRETMEWKYRTHAANGTALIESSWYEVVNGSGLEQLQADLGRMGLVLRWDPDRPTTDRWATPVSTEDLTSLLRTFMAHVKSSGWTREDIERRLGERSGLDQFRTRLFLDVYWAVHDEWQATLRAEGAVDFEDMLVQAAHHLEDGSATSSYDLVMVDEFQDASRARARLVKGLLSERGRFLLAVGDDWQSINRFAGADLSVMTKFEEWFGHGPQLSLTTTFRCPPPICEVASEFVSKNPDQFTKPMRSVHVGRQSPVVIVRSDDHREAVSAILADLSRQVRSTSGAGQRSVATVDVLGRYRYLSGDALPASTPRNLKVGFRTIHAAKGLEADFVIVVGLRSGSSYGFPSTISDDPVLGLAMPDVDGFEHAEERRLLYVALTRARQQVFLVAPTNSPSLFVVELARHRAVEVRGADGADATPCAECGRGMMVQRTGKFGDFLGCSNFPACTNRAKLEAGGRGGRPNPTRF